MTTSRQTEDLNHPAIRELVNSANAMPLSDRVTLLKALIPEVARQMSAARVRGDDGGPSAQGRTVLRRAHAPGAGARLATRHGRARRGATLGRGVAVPGERCEIGSEGDLCGHSAA